MIIALQTLFFFRESLLNVLDRLLRPYYKRFSLTFSRNSLVTSDDDESEEQVFSEFDDERGVVFYPPMYVQRYAAVSDCLIDERWSGKLEKIVDLGYHDMSFIKYLQEVPGVKCILGVDIESIPLRCSSEVLTFDNYTHKREKPLQITLFQGNAADPDYRLIGCDAVVAIEMIEHMLPHDLERLVHTVFGFIKPWIVIFTTPNADFNVLFKALEINRLRRLDHLFEWTREQFNDWCSNIVMRYPQYSVSCKGIGPGPPGTNHLGCCSQLALFVAKDYHKQQDLKLNTLALVANAPIKNNMIDMIDMIGSWETPETLTENNMLCKAKSFESYTEFLYSDKQSHVTILITSPTYSLESMDHEDKISQCDLDIETGKNFLMFDDEQLCHVLVPRRKCNTRVYEIEDVCRRLNCTTLQVKKFSKTTQNLLDKNKLEYLTHTRDVVDEIRHLTQMLNSKKDCLNQPDEDRLWCNINWGENAPYWNQHYKVVREYSYPNETKSEDCRILDLILDEINRLIDTQYDEEFAVDVNKLEIPIEYLMRTVEHITDDVEKVKDLLEWNGYEIVDNVVIHSRRVMDTESVGSQDDDWLENNTLSDCCTNDHTTDLRSTTISDGSTIVPVYHGRCIRRALDHKVRKLRNMLSADEDITMELDKIVCRLMKLALRHSRDRRNIPPSRWMQCKLLDLLTLAEKAIERRKRHFIENYPLKAIDFDDESMSEEMVTLEKIRNDETGKSIVDKYRHIVKEDHSVEDLNLKCYLESDLEDELSVPSTTEFLKNYEHVDKDPVSVIDPSTTYNGKLNAPKLLKNDNTKLERTQAWVEEDIETVSYPNHENFDISSGDTDHSVSKIDKHKYKKALKNHKTNLDSFKAAEVVSCKKRKDTKKIKNKRKTSNTKFVKKLPRKESSYNNLFTNSSNKLVTKEYHNFGLRIKRKKEYHRTSSSKPIPKSLIELCHPEIHVPKNSEDFIYPRIRNDSPVDKQAIAATEESFLIDIIMDDRQETIALRRTIGTDADDEQEILVKSISGHIEMDGVYIKDEDMTENVHSRTIYLNDINEPSTSKGIRHNSTNAQCGPDAIHDYSVLSAATSFQGITKTSSKYKIGDLYAKSSHFGTCTNDEYSCNRTLSGRIKSVGIHIRDSDSNIYYSNKLLYCDEKDISADFGTLTYDNNETKLVGIRIRNSDNKLSESKFKNLPNNYINTNDFGTTTNDMLDKSNTITIELVDPLHRNFSSLGVSSISDDQNYNINNKNANFILTTQDNYQRPSTIVQKQRSVEIYIKDSITNCDEMECSTVTNCALKIQVGDTTDYLTPDETKLLKPALSVLKIKDYISDFNESVGSPSDLRLKSFESSELPKLITNKCMRPKLSCGVVHVHSYKDKQLSEDVVYQGEWQGYKPNASAKKKPQLPSIPKKVTEAKLIKKKISFKEKISTPTTSMKEFMPMPKKRMQMRNFLTTRPNLDVPKTNKQNLTNKEGTARIPKVTKPLRSVTKVASKITMSTKSSKTKISYSAKKPTILSISLKKTGVKPQNLTHKSYIPPYLKRNLEKIQQSKINNMNRKLDIVETTIKVNKEWKDFPTKPIVHTKTEHVGKDLFKFDVIPPENISYLVFRNDIENNGGTSVGQSELDSRSREKKNDSVNKRPYSSPSQNSSTCSSPNSIATVRPASKRLIASKKPSNISHKSNIGTSSSENTTPNKNKKIVKRVKSIKKPTDKEFDNKENVPQTSGQCNKETERKSMSSFVGRHNSVFVAQLTKDSQSTIISVSKKTLSNKSNIKIPAAVDSSHTLLKPVTPLATSKKSSKSELFLDNEESERISGFNSDNSNMVIVLEPQQTKEVEISGETTNIVVDNNFLNEWLNKNVTRSRSSIMTTVRQLIEETLDFIDVTFDKDNSFHSETVLLSHEDLNQSSEDGLSLSQKTVITTENNINTIIESDLENALNRTFDSTLGDESIVSLTDTRLTITDLDLISFQSITTVTKNSESFLADSELNNSNYSHNGSVCDIFERKDPILTQNLPDTVAFQMFSGFSLNAEPITGTRPDLVNLIDSETGSITRQATSEEVFVSGRSSGSYESCLLEEDAVVPDWLFRIISQQQSADEEDRAAELRVPVAPMMLPMPTSNPIIDANGNDLEPVLGVGAGDGRGMHSDRSQGSSGRGTSLSSTDTSSGQQSETILIDPFTGQLELLRDSVDNDVVVSNYSDANESDNALAMDDGANASNTNHNRQNGFVPDPLLATSDFDADISSLDTDVPDSSDN